MPVFTKRWDDPKGEEDGFRLLICRYRPRGISKAAETWDAWQPELGPSVALHAAAYGKGRIPLAWAAYRSAYLLEMRQQKPAIAELARRVAAGETLTLLCSSACEDARRCHRTLLKALIERESGLSDLTIQPD